MSVEKFTEYNLSNCIESIRKDNFNIYNIISMLDKKTELYIDLYLKNKTLTFGNDIISKISELHFYNLVIWLLEDQIRDSGYSDYKKVANIKKEIDKYNIERNRLINTIDFCFSKVFPRPKYTDLSKLYVNSQTLGEIIDKISIITLKLYFFNVKYKNLEFENKKLNVNKNKLFTAIQNLIQLRNYTALCFERYFNKLLNGEGFMPYGNFKLYGKRKMQYLL